MFRMGVHRGVHLREDIHTRVTINAVSTHVVLCVAVLGLDAVLIRLDYNDLMKTSEISCNQLVEELRGGVCILELS